MVKIDVEVILAPTAATERQKITVIGRQIDDKHVSIADVGKVIETEAFLERLTGHRWHLQVSSE